MQVLLDQFFQYLLTEKCVAQNTLLAYQRDLNQFLDYLKQYLQLDQINTISSDEVKAFIYHMKKEMNLGPRSTARKISAIKAFDQYVNRYHDVPLFSQAVVFPQLPKQLPRHLTQEQVQLLFEAVEQDKTLTGLRNKVMLYLLYVCGVRVSELVSLRITNIEWTDKILVLQGKGDKQRMIPLPEDLITMLDSYLKNIHQKLLGNVAQAPSVYLFPVAYAGKIHHISRQAFWKILKTIAKNAGLMQNISPHVLRHSLATHLLKKGANLRHLQALLGHEKISTVQIYTHIELSSLQEMYDRYHIRA